MYSILLNTIDEVSKKVTLLMILNSLRKWVNNSNHQNYYLFSIFFGISEVFIQYFINVYVRVVKPGVTSVQQCGETLTVPVIWPVTLTQI